MDVLVNLNLCSTEDMLMTHSQHNPKFLSYLNSKRPNIKFTCDMENDGTILILDEIVTRNNNQLLLQTNLHRFED